MKFVLRPDISRFAGKGDMFAELRHTQVNGEQKVAAFFLALFMFAMFAPSIYRRIFLSPNFLMR